MSQKCPRPRARVFEVVRDIHLEVELFAVDNDLRFCSRPLSSSSALRYVHSPVFRILPLYCIIYTWIFRLMAFLHPSSGQNQVPEADGGNVPRTQRGRSSQAPNCWCDVSIARLFSLCRKFIVAAFNHANAVGQTTHCACGRRPITAAKAAHITKHCTSFQDSLATPWDTRTLGQS